MGRVGNVGVCRQTESEGPNAGAGSACAGAGVEIAGAGTDGVADHGAREVRES